MNASPSPAADQAAQPGFIQKQYQFTAHIRDPESNPRPPEVEERRMAIYRELVYNNVEGFLSDNFPVLRQTLSDEFWHAMVRDFFIRHRARTPLFTEISQEFITYLQEERDTRDDPPFMLELAHYEWVELALAFSDEDERMPAADPNGDLFEGVPVPSPLAWNLSYRFAVHRIGPDYRPEGPDEQPTHLVAYRNRKDEVEFLEINAVTQRLIELVKENPQRTGHSALKQIAEELNHPQPELVLQAGRDLLLQLRERDIFLGTRP